MPDPRKKSAGEISFIDQKTRQLCVKWCELAVATDNVVIEVTDGQVYIDHAITKKWLSAKGGYYRLLGAGWQTGARFLKR